MPDSPIGSVIAYAGEVTRAWERQNGWLRCDGRQLDNTQPDNVALFKAIGFAWGGDGDSMFNVPDLQGFFLRGVSVCDSASAGRG
jgi:microcystin-dependent protein